MTISRINFVEILLLGLGLYIVETNQEKALIDFIKTTKNNFFSDVRPALINDYEEMLKVINKDITEREVTKSKNVK